MCVGNPPSPQAQKQADPFHQPVSDRHPAAASHSSLCKGTKVTQSPCSVPNITRADSSDMATPQAVMQQPPVLSLFTIYVSALLSSWAHVIFSEDVSKLLNYKSADLSVQFEKKSVSCVMPPSSFCPLQQMSEFSKEMALRDTDMDLCG